MPEIANILGVRLFIYYETSPKHNTPHLHALFAEFSAEMDFDGNILAGSLPKNKEKKVQKWVAAHKRELSAAWELAQNHANPGKIS